MKYWEIIADESQQSPVELGLGLSRIPLAVNYLNC